MASESWNGMAHGDSVMNIDVFSAPSRTAMGGFVDEARGGAPSQEPPPSTSCTPALAGHQAHD